MTAPGGSRVWLVTGAGRGLGRAFTDKAIRAGDQVIATLRAPAAARELADRHGDSILTLSVDVTDRAADLAPKAGSPASTG